MRKLVRLTILTTALGVAAAVGSGAQAETGFNVGTLSCQVASGWGLILGSARPLVCDFARYGGAPERYIGTIYKFGLDIGYTQGGALIWSVIAPSVDVTPGVLAGTYAGAAASATVGFGVGANGLVGGFFNSIMLQPLSIETNQGIDVSAGVATMTLSPG